MMMQGQGSEMSNMLPLLLLMRDDESSTATAAAPGPTLAPAVQTLVNNYETLIKLIGEMDLESLAPIPSEWGLPSDGISDETIELLKSKPDLSIEDATKLILDNSAVETLEGLVKQSSLEAESGSIPVADSSSAQTSSDAAAKESEIMAGLSAIPAATTTKSPLIADENVAADAFALLSGLGK